MIKKTKYKFIHFLLEPTGRAYLCLNNKTNSYLGEVDFYKPWKQWVFSAWDESCVFSHECLTDIADFLRQLNTEYNEIGIIK